LLTELGFTFEIIVPYVNVALIEGLSPAEFAAELSRRKLGAVAEIAGANLCGCPQDKITCPRAADDRPYNDQTTIIAADTIVALSERILGKPTDEREAFEMLRTLSGGWHSVFTGLSVGDLKTQSSASYADSSFQKEPLKIITQVCETRVKFRELSDEEIRAYIASGEPFDKAGGYGIQGAARDFVETFDGSYTNVVGLPTEMLVEILGNFG